MESERLILGDCLEVLKQMGEKSIHCCVTSPPYWGLRDYGVAGQLGLEKTPEEYVATMVSVFREVKRVLRDDGTLWLNLGDSYATAGGKQSAHRDTNGGFSGSPGTRTQGYALAGGGFQRPHSISGVIKEKDLVGIPWRVAFALQADGWYLRQDIIWHKPNPMPESVRDRCTKSHEYIFLLSKSPKYYFDSKAMKELAVGPGKKCGPKNDLSRNDSDRTQIVRGDGIYRNRRSVWTISTKPFKGAHFATFPEALITPCVLAGCPKEGVVLDPFFGAGTVGVVAKKHGRAWVGIELNGDYVSIAKTRIACEN